jgi:hypothetical protein
MQSQMASLGEQLHRGRIGAFPASRALGVGVRTLRRGKTAAGGEVGDGGSTIESIGATDPLGLGGSNGATDVGLGGATMGTGASCNE